MGTCWGSHLFEGVVDKHHGIRIPLGWNRVLFIFNELPRIAATHHNPGWGFLITTTTFSRVFELNP
jgi:hypothetical protein